MEKEIKFRIPSFSKTVIFRMRVQDQAELLGMLNSFYDWPLTQVKTKEDIEAGYRYSDYAPPTYTITNEKEKEEFLKEKSASFKPFSRNIPVRKLNRYKSSSNTIRRSIRLTKEPSSYYNLIFLVVFFSVIIIFAIYVFLLKLRSLPEPA